MARIAPRTTLFPYTTLFRSYDNAARLTTELRKLPDLLNVTSDLQISNPQATVTINRDRAGRSEEHTSELQSPMYLVCRLLLEKKKYETRQQSLGSAAQRSGN